MESGSELSKTVATFILQKILQDETGLYYICQTYDRYFSYMMYISIFVDCKQFFHILLKQFKVWIIVFGCK